MIKLLKRLIVIFLSRVINVFLPADAEKILNEERFVSYNQHGILRRVLRKVLLHDLYYDFNNKPEREREKLARDLWVGDSRYNWHVNHMNRYLSGDESFDSKRLKYIEDSIESIGGVKKICDLGCGDGRIIKYLYENMSIEAEFIGIDINTKIINVIKKKYKHLPIKFINSAFEDYIKDNGVSNTLFITSIAIP